MKCELVHGSRMLQDTLLHISILVLDPTDVYAMHIYKEWDRLRIHIFWVPEIGLTLTPFCSHTGNRQYHRVFRVHNHGAATVGVHRQWTIVPNVHLRGESRTIRSARGKTGGRAAPPNGLLLCFWSRLPKGLQGTSLLLPGHYNGTTWHTWASKEQTHTL